MSKSPPRLTPHSLPSKSPRVIRLLVFVVVLLCSFFAQGQLALGLMEKWRAAAKLGPIGSKAAKIAQSTFGHADETMIQLKPAR